MNTKEILQNIHYFIDTVLRSACFENYWNEKSLNESFEWAKYCEKVYKESFGRSFYHQLDNYIIKLGNSISKSPVPVLNLEFLQISQRFLQFCLYQNPHLDTSLLKILLDKSLEEENNIEEDLSLIAYLGSTLPELQAVLSPQLETNLLLNQLIKENLFHINEDIIQAALEPYWGTQINTIVELLKSKNKALASLKPIIFNILEKKVNAPYFNTPTSNNLWSLPWPTLCPIINSHPPLFELFVSFLQSTGNDMEKDISVGNWRLRERCNIKPRLSFTEITNYIKELTFVNQPSYLKIKYFLKKRLKSKTTSSGFWEEVIVESQKKRRYVQNIII